jgi:hypothetical protein
MALPGLTDLTDTPDGAGLTPELVRSTRRLTVALPVGDDNEPPKEFRLFRYGLNPSRNDGANGPAIFDDEAARLVMAAYEQHASGPDGQGMRRPVMIDLEHLAVKGHAKEMGWDGVPDLHPLDARGWCALELRDDGLWAVDVDWTDDGARRIREKRQRSVSPSFWWETLGDGSERVTEIESIGLTAKPATDGPFGLNSRAKGQRQMKLTKADFMARWGKMPVAERRLLARLCEIPSPEQVKPDQACRLLAIAMGDLQKVVKAMGGEVGDLGAMIQTVMAWVDDLKATLGGQAPVGEPPSTEPGDNGGGGDVMMANKPEDESAVAMATRRAATEQLALLRQRDEKLSAEVAKLRAAQDKRDADDKVELFRAAVAAGTLNAGEVWQDGNAGQLKPRLARWSRQEIEEYIKDRGGQPTGLALSFVTPRPPTGASVTAADGIEMSEYEALRLRSTVDRVRREANLGQATEADYTMALERYQDYRGQQSKWAATQEHQIACRYGRKIEQKHCLATVTGRILPDAPKLLSTPVQPIDGFSDASGRALEEFREEHLLQLAAALPDWTDEIGQTIQVGGLGRVTWPMHFQTTEYRERTAQGAPTSTPQTAEINVNQREFYLSMQANLKRMMGGDFAYIRSWQQQGAQMARARVKLRARLIVALLEANGKWAVSEEFPNGLDGENFFSQSHLNNPFQPSYGTSSNLSDATQPFGADTLTAEKAQVLLVKDWDGVHLNMMADDIFLPTILAEEARLLIDVKDVILRDSAAKDAAGGVTNEHKDSGMGRIVAPQLDGAAGLASDWYLISRGIIAQGKTPWVIAENGEEVREWDQSSGFYKDSGDIKVQSHIHLNALLVWWQGIRKILGS